MSAVRPTRPLSAPHFTRCHQRSAGNFDLAWRRRPKLIAAYTWMRPDTLMSNTRKLFLARGYAWVWPKMLNLSNGFRPLEGTPYRRHQRVPRRGPPRGATRYEPSSEAIRP
jgi:5-formyltetrahydrofolate cyclo-ligase